MPGNSWRTSPHASGGIDALCVSPAGPSSSPPPSPPGQPRPPEGRRRRRTRDAAAPPAATSQRRCQRRRGQDLFKAMKLQEHERHDRGDDRLRDRPKPGTDALPRIMLAWLAEVHDVGRHAARATKMYTDAFTEAELKQIAAFYSSPAGQKVLEKAARAHAAHRDDRARPARRRTREELRAPLTPAARSSRRKRRPEAARAAAPDALPAARRRSRPRAPPAAPPPAQPQPAAVGRRFGFTGVSPPDGWRATEEATRQRPADRNAVGFALDPEPADHRHQLGRLLLDGEPPHRQDTPQRVLEQVAVLGVARHARSGHVHASPCTRGLQRDERNGLHHSDMASRGLVPLADASGRAPAILRRGKRVRSTSAHADASRIHAAELPAEPLARPKRRRRRRRPCARAPPTTDRLGARRRRGRR